MNEITKYSLLSCLMLPFVASAQWELVDDFENGFDKWTIHNRLSRTEHAGLWDSSWGTVPRPFDSFGGSVLAAAEGSLNLQVLDVGIDLGPLPLENNYTLFYEISQPDLSADRAMGLHPDTPEFWFTLRDDGTYAETYGYPAFATIHRLGVPGSNVFSASGTGGYAANYSDDQRAETWYRFWMVIYPNDFKWDLYVQGGEFAEITKVTTSVEGGYSWRNLTFDPLRTWRLRIGGRTSSRVTTGAPTYLDNFYLDRSGVNLTLPPLEAGTTPMGPGIFAAYPLSGASVDTGAWMGSVDVGLYPWFHIETLGGWGYASGAAATSGAWIYLAADAGAAADWVSVPGTPFVYQHDLNAWAFAVEGDAAGQWIYLFN